MNLVEVYGLLIAGLAALVAGLLLVRPRFRAASGADKALVLGPVFEAGAMAVFAAEHFLAAQDIMPARAALAAGSFVLDLLCWRCLDGCRHQLHRLAACALVSSTARTAFLIIVATIDLPNLPINAGKRLFWTLTFRELAFAGGAMVLAGSMWPHRTLASTTLIRLGRGIVATVLVFYGIQHFLFPLFVPGVPLEKLIPAWVPAPLYSPYLVGIILVLSGIGLFVRQRSASQPPLRDHASPAHGFFYGPILALESTHRLAVEGINYVGDTLLFAATALLAGFGADGVVLNSAGARS